VQLVYGASAGARRALATAVQLGALTGGQVIVTLISDSPDSGQHLQAEVDERLQQHQLKGRFRQLINPTAQELAQSLRLAGGGTLIISADHPLLEGEGLPTLLEVMDCSVILVR
jgi:hypothetical protein